MWAQPPWKSLLSTPSNCFLKKTPKEIYKKFEVFKHKVRVIFSSLTKLCQGHSRQYSTVFTRRAVLPMTNKLTFWCEFGEVPLYSCTAHWLWSEVLSKIQLPLYLNFKLQYKCKVSVTLSISQKKKINNWHKVLREKKSLNKVLNEHEDIFFW